MTPVRIGLLRLSDSAPVLLAAHDGLFAQHGLAADISVEPSWANVADKLAYGLLDAAVMLPPLALAAVFGLRGPQTRLVVPMGLTLGGNAVVLAPEAAHAIGAANGGLDPLDAGRRLVGWMRVQSRPPRLAVVHTYSTHNLLLRYWLAAAGGDPDRDWETVIVPPENVVDVLAEGRIAGFCAGAPWGDVAVERGIGTVLLGTSAIWPRHPEKCFALAESWAAAHPDAITPLLRALLQAGRICDRPDEAPRVAELLIRSGIAAPPSALLAALPGGKGREHISFHAEAAWLPRSADARWFLEQMQRWRWLDRAPDFQQRINGIYRSDWLKPAALAEGLAWSDGD